MSDKELAALAATQHSLVARHQALDYLTAKQIEDRLGARRLLIVRRSIYRFAGAAPSRWEPIMAACMAAGPGAVASHRSAAELWGMRMVVSELPEIMVVHPMWPRLPGVRTHQTTLLPLKHCSERHGVPVLSAARTIFTLSSCLNVYLLGRVLDDSLRRGIVNLREMHDMYEYLWLPGRHGLKHIREVLRARPLDHHPGDSDAELDLVQILVDAGLPKPVQQYPVDVGSTVYYLDAAYPELRIGMEAHSWDYHRSRTAFDHDTQRENRLRIAGWNMLYFTSTFTPNQVVSDVTAARQMALNGEHSAHDPPNRGEIAK